MAYCMCSIYSPFAVRGPSASILICAYLGAGVVYLLKWTSNDRTQCPTVPFAASVGPNTTKA